MSAHKHSKATLRIACNDVVPGCGCTASADTDEQLFDKVAAHAPHDHGVPEVTPAGRENQRREYTPVECRA